MVEILGSIPSGPIHMISRPLSQLRSRITAIDDRLVQLLAKRFSTAGKIATLKKEGGVALVDARRQKEILMRVRKLSRKNGISPLIAQRIFRKIITESEIFMKHGT